MARTRVKSVKSQEHFACVWYIVSPRPCYSSNTLISLVSWSFNVCLCWLMIQDFEENTMGILYKYNSNIFGTISNQIFNPLPMTVSLQVWKRFQKFDPTREVPQFQPPFWVDDKLSIQTNDLGIIFLPYWKKPWWQGGRSYVNFPKAFGEKFGLWQKF